DNNTTPGWIKDLKGKEKKMARSYLGRGNRKKLRKCIEAVWSSCAITAIMPVQDLLRLGSQARLNTPGTLSQNWVWRFDRKQLKTKHGRMLSDITVKYNRQRSATS
ncbi:MAG: 4-alpha-glucanotransferase, partial [Prolixibacteraceae bacterium]|nr:4-alpha-glucanotransferase [Prolixibacteraceae bacterium]